MNLLNRIALSHNYNACNSLRLMSTHLINSSSTSQINRNRLSSKQLPLGSEGSSIGHKIQLNMVPHRSYASNSILDRVKKFFGWHLESKYALRAKSVLLYETSVDNIDYPLFFRTFDLPNTFMSWFVITELHVWMMMVRVMDIGEKGRMVRNGIVQELWNDASIRSKSLGKAAPSLVREQLVELSDQFQYFLIAYDEGLMSNDRQFASALWSRVFDQNCDDFGKIELMVKYIRANVKLLDAVDDDELIHKRNFKWIDLEACKSL